MTRPALLSLRQVCRTSPQADAIVTDRAKLSYSDLWRGVQRRAEELSGQLQAWGVAPTAEWRSAHTVAFSPRSNLGDLFTLLALVELGVPVALLHPSWTDSERARALEAIGVQHVVESDPGTARPSWLKREAPADTGDAVSTAAERVIGPSEPDASAERILAILFTSGSSGHPKAVALSHRAFRAATDASAAHLGWAPGDRWLLALPLAHVGGLSVVLRCLLAGQCCVLSDASTLGRAHVLARAITQHGVSLLSLVPTQLSRLLELSGFELPSRVRVVLLGGAAAPSHDLAQARARGWPVLTTYGMTEACSQIATEIPGSAKLRVLPGIELAIHGDHIALRGPTLFSGYASASGLTPSVDADGWYHTQDLGELDRGVLEVLGRRDTVIVSGGENVEPEEVERVLLTHPACVAACVVGVPDPEWGQRVVAVVQLADGLSEQALLHHVRERLSGFKCPKRVLCLDAFPVTPLGKPRRRAVQAWATERLLSNRSPL